jgi:hypothetical protein
VLRLTYQQISAFQLYQSRGGTTYGERRILPVLRAACTANNDPVLTRDQVTSLMQLAASGDGSLLRQVRTFA